MSAEAYAYTALAMRYFFIAAILVILAQMVFQSISEYRELRRAKNQVSGAYSHYLVFTDPEELRGAKYALNKENSIGYGKNCNVRLSYKGIRKRQANIYQNGEDMWFSTNRRRKVFHNGEPVKKWRFSLRDGDRIELSGVRFTYMTRREAPPEAQAHE